MSVRLVQLADVHLGAPMEAFGDHARQRREELEAAFRRAIDTALEERAQIVAIAGDLFDTWRPDPETVELARDQLGRLADAGVKTFLVPGVHDGIGWSDSVYRTESLPVHRMFSDPEFESTALEIEGLAVTVHGAAHDPWSRRGWRSLRPSEGEGVDVVVVHAAVAPVTSPPAGERVRTIDEGELDGLGVEWIALGHAHDRKVFSAGDRPLGAYTGSVEGRDWTETGPRHVLVIEWEGPGPPSSVRSVEVHSRILETGEVAVDGLRDQESIAAAVSEACDPDRLWRVRLVGTPETVPAPRVVEATLRPRFDHVRVEDHTTLAGSRLVAERLDEETVRGELARRLVELRESAGRGRERRVADRAIKLGVKVFG